MDRDSLWFRVLPTRYGMEGGCLCDGGCDASAWWRDILALLSAGWFNCHVSRSLGDGTNTFFWTDVWVGEVSLQDRFNRLYDFSLLKGESVYDMSTLGWGLEGAAWSWTRRLFSWEEEVLGELRILLQNVTLQVLKEDRWIWSLEPSNIYSVCSAYNLTVQVPLDHAG